MRRGIPIALTVALALTGVGQGAAYLSVREATGGDPVLLRVRLEEGDTIGYRSEVEMDGRVSASLFSQPFELRLELTQDWLVEEVDAAGVASIAITTAIVSLESEPEEVPLSDLSAIEEETTMRIRPDGSLDGFDLDPAVGSPLGLPSFEGAGPTFPDHPVAPGDSWEISYEVPVVEGGDSLRVEGENVFERFEDVGGTRTARIASTISMPFDLDLALADLGDPSLAGAPPGARMIFSGAARMTGLQWVDLETGVQARAEVEGEIEMRFEFSGLGPMGVDEPLASEGGGTVPSTLMEFDVRMTLERR